MPTLIFSKAYMYMSGLFWQRLFNAILSHTFIFLLTLSIELHTAVFRPTDFPMYYEVLNLLPAVVRL